MKKEKFPKNLAGVVRRAFVDDVRKTSFDLKLNIGKKKQKYTFFESKAEIFKHPLKGHTVWCLFYGTKKKWINIRPHEIYDLSGKVVYQEKNKN